MALVRVPPTWQRPERASDDSVVRRAGRPKTQRGPGFGACFG
jgi:hypothetical protein